MTNNSTDDVNPYWSPDGSKIVFQAYRDGQPEIYVMNADGSGQTRLTNSNDYDGMPAWSPDGTMIAFASRRTGGYRIYTMNTDGSNQIQRSSQSFSLEPTWSPDSTQIAYSADGDNNAWYEIWLMSANGSAQVLKHNPGSEYDALARSWSPDGKYIAFTRIHYIFYQGNWYWQDSRLEAVGTATGVITVGPNNPPNRDWYPDWQTLDNQKPVSQVTALASVSPATFTVNWSGSDTGGSGLKNYDVQIRDGVNGSWTAWKTATTQTSATYTGIGGHTYYFRGRARDNNYNLESWPTTHDTVTTVESSPPQVAMMTLPAYSRRQGFIVQWTGTDPGGSGIASYDVQYREGTGGSWTNLVINTPATSASFDGTAGTTYYFRVRGRDTAQNVSAWPSGNGHTATTLYTWAIEGMATNNAGVPVSGMSATTTPGAFTSLPSDLSGLYGAYVASSASNYTVDWSKSGYGDLPATQFTNSEATHNVVLPPIDNVIQNSHFETGVFGSGDWIATGSSAPIVTQTLQHTGNYVASLGSPIAVTTQSLTSNTANTFLGTDSNGIIHMIWLEGTPSTSGSVIKYSQRASYGDWSSPQLVYQNPPYGLQLSDAVVAPDGQVHGIWYGYISGQGHFMYGRRNTNGTWITSQALVSGQNFGMVKLAVDANNHVHVVYGLNHNPPLLLYRYLRPDNTWSAEESVVTGLSPAQSLEVVIDSQAGIHVMWTAQANTSTLDVYYTQRRSNGSWPSPVNLSNSMDAHSSLFDMGVTSEGVVHVLRGEWSAQGYLVYYQRGYGDSWSPPELLTTGGALGYFGAIAVDEAGSAHLIWNTFQSGSPRRIMYTQRTSAGWIMPSQVIRESTWLMHDLNLEISPSGILHLAWAETTTGLAMAYYVQMTPDGAMKQTFPAYNGTDNGIIPILLVDKNNIPHLLIHRSNNNVHYMSQATANQTGDSTLKQVVTVPVSPAVSVLSYWHWLNGMTQAGGPSFSLHVDDGSSNTPLVTRQTNTVGWEHSWVDLSAWAGQTITVTFNVHQVVDKPMAEAYLDEVTLGSTQPDVWLNGDYQTALPGETVTYAITYGNQGAAAADSVTLNHTLASGLSFVSATVPPTQISGSTLTWNLSTMNSNTGPLTIFVTVQVNPAAPAFTTLSSPLSISTTSNELETSNNQATIKIYLVRMTYLPAIVR
ncbi:MAG: PD40 domain-containing protein [Chloroflexi bacterium]|nr:PD40 domain-containing protein [Chloroflexota bacterium]